MLTPPKRELTAIWPGTKIFCACFFGIPLGFFGAFQLYYYYFSWCILKSMSNKFYICIFRDLYLSMSLWPVFFSATSNSPYSQAVHKLCGFFPFFLIHLANYTLHFRWFVSRFTIVDFISDFFCKKKCLFGLDESTTHSAMK